MAVAAAAAKVLRAMGPSASPPTMLTISAQASPTKTPINAPRHQGPVREPAKEVKAPISTPGMT